MVAFNVTVTTEAHFTFSSIELAILRAALKDRCDKFDAYATKITNTQITIELLEAVTKALEESR